MFAIVITEKGGSQRREVFDQNEVTIGRVQGNDIILGKGNVSKRHSRLVLKDGRFIVVDLKSTNGTYVNGRKITSPLVVKPGDKIYIGDFILTIEQEGAVRDSGQPSSIPNDEFNAPSPVPVAGPPTPHVPPPPPVPSVRKPVPAEHARTIEPEHEPSVPEPSRPAVATPAPPRTHVASEGPPTRGGLAKGQRGLETELGLGGVGSDNPFRALMARLSTDFDIYETSAASVDDHARWAEAEKAIERAVRHLAAEGVLDEHGDHTALLAAALRESVGLGIIEGLLANERVREIVVNGPLQVYADQGNGLEPVAGGFSDGSMLITVAQRLLARAGEHLDPRHAVHEAVLPSGPHVTVILPPVAVRGPIIEIRRIGRGLSADELVAGGVMSQEIRVLLERAIHEGRNVFVSGPTDSGVTTLVGAIAGLAPKKDRLVTVEDVPDLFVDRPGTLALAAGRGRAALTYPEVLEQAARLRSDRLVIDDVSGGELARVVRILSGRAGGNVVGVHAPVEEDALAPLRLLSRLGQTGPTDAIDELLARVANVLVEVETLREGRRVKRVVEVLVAPDGRVECRALYRYDQGFLATGEVASF
ncbi:MAG: ATPase, T2SS/T4P/T4SS family [Polyangiales bacterium]